MFHDIHDPSSSSTIILVEYTRMLFESPTPQTTMSFRKIDESHLIEKLLKNMHAVHHHSIFLAGKATKRNMWNQKPWPQQFWPQSFLTCLNSFNHFFEGSMHLYAIVYSFFPAICISLKKTQPGWQPVLSLKKPPTFSRAEPSDSKPFSWAISKRRGMAQTTSGWPCFL